MIKELKGFHVLMIAVAAFAVIIAANLTMLFAATGSFPGLVVKNSYVAGVGWNARTAEQEALGWQASGSYVDGAVTVGVTEPDGRAITLDSIEITVGRPATDTLDQTFQRSGQGPYTLPAQLAPGKWLVTLTTTGETPFATKLTLFVPDGK